jgi:hypothetical protein
MPSKITAARLHLLAWLFVGLGTTTLAADVSIGQVTSTTDGSGAVSFPPAYSAGILVNGSSVTSTNGVGAGDTVLLNGDIYLNTASGNPVIGVLSNNPALNFATNGRTITVNASAAPMAAGYAYVGTLPFSGAISGNSNINVTGTGGLAGGLVFLDGVDPTGNTAGDLSGANISVGNINVTSPGLAYGVVGGKLLGGSQLTTGSVTVNNPRNTSPMVNFANGISLIQIDGSSVNVNGNINVTASGGLLSDTQGVHGLIVAPVADYNTNPNGIALNNSTIQVAGDINVTTSALADAPAIGVGLYGHIDNSTVNINRVVVNHNAGFEAQGLFLGRIGTTGIVNIGSIETGSQTRSFGITADQGIAGHLTAGAINVYSSVYDPNIFSDIAGLRLTNGNIDSTATVTLGSINAIHSNNSVANNSNLAAGIYAPTSTIAANRLFLNGDIYANAQNGYARGIWAGALLGQDIGVNITAIGDSNALNTHAIYTSGSGNSEISISKNVSIIAKSDFDIDEADIIANGKTDILLGGTNDRLNFAAADYNQIIRVSGAERVDFTGAVTTLRDGSRFNGGGSMNITVGPNATLALLADDVFQAAGNETLTTNTGSILSFGNKDGTDEAVTLKVNRVDLDRSTDIKIGAGVKSVSGNLITADGASFTVAGSLNNVDAYVDQLNAVGGTAAQKLEFSSNNTGLALSIRETTDAEARDNVIANLERLGVRRPVHVATTPFVGALKKFSLGDTRVVPGSQVGQTAQNLMLLLAGNESPIRLNGAEATAATRILSGASEAMSLEAAIASTRSARLPVEARINQVRDNFNQFEEYIYPETAMAAVSPVYSSANHFWAGGLELWEDADPRNADLGYRMNSSGLITGYDHLFSQLLLGGAFAYSHGNFRDKAVIDNSSSLDTYAFNLYGSYNHCSGVIASLIGGYTRNSYDLNSGITSSIRQLSSYNAKTWTLTGNLAYDWRPSEDLTLTPSLGLQYYDIGTGRINGTYTTINHLEQDSFQVPVNLGASYYLINNPEHLLTLSGNLGYTYNFQDQGAEGTLSYNGIINSPLVAIEGRRPGRDSLNLGAGLKYSRGRFETEVKYDYFTMADYDASRLSGTLGINF